ncbi:MAG: bifunctional oligoribonuclease/PAP phosphatase NrnA [Bacilli bacterium]|nr:bifunctional oligoribonuclease/PAP phosphatase NrnA [Bacilli bacterium]
MNFKEKVVNTINDLSKKVKESETYEKINNAVFNDEFRTLKEKLIEKIEEYDKIIIFRHKRPDGDAIGSALGLREVLRDKYPEKKVYAVGEVIPEYLKFVGMQDEILDEDYEGALAIVVDTATEDRISLDKYKLTKEVIKIDHHIPVDNYGTINFVRENFGSCSLVLTDLFDSMNFDISNVAARYIYIAAITDTGRFKYKEVDAKALALASILLSKGIDTEEIFANLYSKDKNVFKLQGYIYNHIKYSENGVAYLFMSKRLMKRFKVKVEDAANGVNLLDSIKGSMIWMFFVEYDNEIRIRFRSRFIEVATLANKYQGGGHAYAAGGSIKSKKDIKKVVADADKALKEYKMQNGDKF